MVVCFHTLHFVLTSKMFHFCTVTTVDRFSFWNWATRKTSSSTDWGVMMMMFSLSAGHHHHGNLLKILTLAMQAISLEKDMLSCQEAKIRPSDCGLHRNKRWYNPLRSRLKVGAGQDIEVMMAQPKAGYGFQSGGPTIDQSSSCPVPLGNCYTKLYVVWFIPLECSVFLHFGDPASKNMQRTVS